jgi:hypothetical protein
METIRLVIFLVVIVTVAATPVSAQHEGDVLVGRTQASQLTRGGFDVDENYITLSPVSGLLNGWTDNDPGFDRVLIADPEADLWPLQAGAQVVLRVVAIQPALRSIDSSFSILDEPGEQTVLGNQDLHVHLTWHINSQSPAFDPDQCVWEATFRLRDAGSTNYQDSPPFVMKFTNVEQIIATGDSDDDADVDGQDHANLPECLAGPDIVPQPTTFTTCEIDCLNWFDLDDENDVDLRDIAEFQNVFGEE